MSSKLREWNEYQKLAVPDPQQSEADAVERQKAQELRQPATLREALEDIRIAFRQIEFTIKLLSFCELGKLVATDFDTDHTTALAEGNLNFPSGNFSDDKSITRAATICVASAFGASALALETAFKVAGIANDPKAINNFGQLQILVYMVRCAYAHGIADPWWDVKPKYKRTITVTLDGESISLDLPSLHGRPFDFKQIGGHRNWYRIRDAVLCELSKKAAATA